MSQKSDNWRNALLAESFFQLYINHICVIDRETNEKKNINLSFEMTKSGYVFCLEQNKSNICALYNADIALRLLQFKLLSHLYVKHLPTRTQFLHVLNNNRIQLYIFTIPEHTNR